MYGYQQPGDATINKQTVPEDKNLSLLDQAPIAFFVENGVDADRFVNKNQSPFTLNIPIAFHLFASDTLAPDVGFFGELEAADGATDVAKLSLINAFFAGSDHLHAQAGNLDPVEHGVTEHDLFTRTGYTIQDMDLGGVNLAEEHVGVRLYGTFGSSVTKKLMHPPAAAQPSENEEMPPPAENPPANTPPAVQNPPSSGDPQIDALEREMRDLQKKIEDLKNSRKKGGSGGNPPAGSGGGGQPANHGPLVSTQEQEEEGTQTKPATPPAKTKGGKKQVTEGDQGEENTEEEDPMNKLKGFLWEVAYYNSNAVANDNGIATTRDAGDFGGRVNAYFNNDSFVGLFGFAGRTTVPDTMGNTLTNNYRLGGADLSVGFGRKMEKTPGMPLKEFNLLASYIVGTSDNPGGDGVAAHFNGGFVELEKLFGQKAIGSVKYERVHAGALANLPTNAGLRDNALTFNFTYYLRTNFWLGLEYTHDLKSHSNNHALGLVFDFAF